MTAISPEDSELDAFIDDIAVLRPYTRVTKEAKRKLKTLIKQREEQVRQETINRVANTDFVYEVMNAPTNGAAVEWIRSHLSLTSKKTKGE